MRALDSTTAASLAVLWSGLPPSAPRKALHTAPLLWEYAHAADPLWDLAGWCANNDLADDVGQALLASYAGRAPTRNEYLRLKLLGWLYDYVCLLWSELYSNLQRDDPQGGIAARAELLAARLNSSPSGRAD